MAGCAPAQRACSNSEGSEAKVLGCEQLARSFHAASVVVDARHPGASAVKRVGLAIVTTIGPPTISPPRVSARLSVIVKMLPLRCAHRVANQIPGNRSNAQLGPSEFEP